MCDRTLLVGVAGGYMYSPFSVDDLMTSGIVEGGHVALYGVKRFASVYCRHRGVFALLQ